jgi:hypothetical protein
MNNPNAMPSHSQLYAEKAAFQDRLVAYIKLHGHQAYISTTDELRAEEQYSFGAPEWVTIPQSFQAVRDWLGY